MLKVNEIRRSNFFSLKSSLQLFDFVVSLFTQLVELIYFFVKNHASSLSVFNRNREYYCFSEWLVIFIDEWFSIREFWWINLKDLRKTTLKFFETFFNKWTFWHDEIWRKNEIKWMMMLSNINEDIWSSV